MRSNKDPETGIAYGYISSIRLNYEVVDELLFGGIDIGYQSFIADLEATLDLDTDEGQAAYDEAIEMYECDELRVKGTYQGVSYASSWMGGALNFFIFKSPYTAQVGACSLCVPGAGDLGSEGDMETYSVPPEWKFDYEG